MSTVSNVNNSLLYNYLLSKQQTDSNQSATDQTTKAAGSDSQAQSQKAEAVDVVSLSKEILQQSREALFNAQSNWFTSTEDASENSGAGIASSDVYGLLLSNENARLMQASPDLVKNIISQVKAALAEDPSQDSASQLLQAIGNIDLMNMSPEALLALEQNATDSSASDSQTGSGSNADKKE